MANKIRNTMCTINFNQEIDPLKALPDFTRFLHLKRATFQLEKASRKHWQVFLEFNRPVTKKHILSQAAQQDKQMHIGVDTFKHPLAGRNYVQKDTPIDGHRYKWTSEKGWKNNKQPFPLESPPQKTKTITISEKQLINIHDKWKYIFETGIDEDMRCRALRKMVLIDHILQGYPIENIPPEEQEEIANNNFWEDVKAITKSELENNKLYLWCNTKIKII